MNRAEGEGRFGSQLSATLGMLFGWLLLACDPTEAQQLFGNGSVSLQESRSAPSQTPRSGLYSTRAALTVEDILMYKNRFRLGAHLDWRDDFYSPAQEFRPIYSGSLTGYGYHLTTTFSPYWRYSSRQGDSTQSNLFRVYNREWRSSLLVNPARLPTFNLVFARNRQFDRERLPVYSLLQETWVAEIGYVYRQSSAKGNYNRRRTDNYVTGATGDIIRAVSGTGAISQPLPLNSSLSTTYTYYESRRTIQLLSAEESRTHAAAVLVTNRVIAPLGMTASYSGRFVESTTRFASRTRNRSENMSALLSFTPARFAELQAGKTYQIEGSSGQFETSEYVTLTASFSRFLRRGVDTRLAVTRTIFQQSNRLREIRDSSGSVIATEPVNHYAINTWYGSIQFAPRAYVRADASYSITHDSRPLAETQRYQATGTFTSTFVVRDGLDLRLGYTSSFSSERLRIGRGFAENWNLGASWIPRQYMNLAVTYIRSESRTSIRSTNGYLSLYFSYSVPRVFSWYFSYGQQDKSQGPTRSGDVAVLSTASQAASVSAQLLVHTGTRSSISLAYVKASDNAGADRPDTRTETYQVVYNFQM